MCQDTRSGGLNDLLASAEIGHDALVDLSRKEAFEAPDDLAFGSAIGSGVARRPASHVRYDSGIRQRTRRVTNWKNGEMALRWSAVAFVETEKNYRRITGYEHLWMLKAHLDRDDDNIAEMQKVG